MLGDFKAFLKKTNVSYTDADFATNQDWVKSNIKGDLFTSQFGALEGQHARADSDPQIAKALTFMPEAHALEQNALKAAQQKTASLR